ncbi:MAG: ribonuclease HII [Candidatus Methanoperedens sp.]|nr:ribonuclease HII [Candidatus Methanoperedens sp.]MCZ7369436.1 ribonuclease HII [Candidatus Methanoperedens sp.]
MIAGIDEAGKGPVLGPMCVAGVLMDENKLDALAKIGVRDSKQLTPEKRENLEIEIKKLAHRYFILEVSPIQIDELRKIMTMNEIMVACYARILDNLKPDHAFVDAADVIAERFGKNIRKRYSRTIEITSEHRADEKYPIVSAASIIAKVQRDALVKQIEKTRGVEIGSGYPSDPITIKFLEEWVQEHGSLPDFARSSWETSKRIVEKFDKNQRKFSDF